MSAPHLDLTPVVDLVAEPGTGPSRARRPVYRNFLPPCNHACPAGENIQAWLAHTTAGCYREAWEALVRDNPLPALHGRVCYHPCESACNRGELDSAVSIHAVERFLGDLAIRESWPLPVDAAGLQPGARRRVLVVGCGPAGLAAAYHLARVGHAVEIRDAEPSPGGMLRFGIPAYRLPREVLAAEVRRIEALGVKLVLGHRVKNLAAEMHDGGFDAAFVAIGAHASQHIDIPARDAARVLEAVPLLHDVSLGGRPRLGRRVVVYGGGNTAIDAARTAMRLGGAEPLIIYRRDRAHMPARAFEAAEAEEEGVRFQWLTSIRDIAGAELTLERMELDADGRPQPTGELEKITADAVVLAIGQQSESAFLATVPGVELTDRGAVKVGPNLMTGHPGIFAGGDLVARERTVTAAVGHGKGAALHIDAWLRGTAHVPPPEPPIVSHAMLHLPIFSDVLRTQQPKRPPQARVQDFTEVVAGLTEPAARYEARRCFSCGNCFECDACYAACPERAIEKRGAGRGYEIHYDRCTGCAVCFETCPCHAIEMLLEPQ
jgi:NADPH-dependent glutamate synthase beta subunit-like oxidoreductase